MDLISPTDVASTISEERLEVGNGETNAAAFSPVSSPSPGNEEEGDICVVCYDGCTYDDDEIVYCDKCEIPVHQKCYGIDEVPSGAWFCDVCLSAKQAKEVVCELCHEHGGAFQQTIDDEDKWVHTLCGLSYDEICEATPNRTVFDLSLLDPARLHTKLKCVVCKQKDDRLCTQCSHGRCCVPAHPRCIAQDRANTTYIEMVSRSGAVCWGMLCKTHKEAAKKTNKSGDTPNKQSNSQSNSNPKPRRRRPPQPRAPSLPDTLQKNKHKEDLENFPVNNDIKCESIAMNRLRLSWRRADRAMDSTIRYLVRQKDPSDIMWAHSETKGQPHLGDLTASITVECLKPDTAYFFQICAMDDDDNSSDWIISKSSFRTKKASVPASPMRTETEGSSSPRGGDGYHLQYQRDEGEESEREMWGDAGFSSEDDDNVEEEEHDEGEEEEGEEEHQSTKNKKKTGEKKRASSGAAALKGSTKKAPRVKSSTTTLSGGQQQNKSKPRGHQQPEDDDANIAAAAVAFSPKHHENEIAGREGRGGGEGSVEGSARKKKSVNMVSLKSNKRVSTSSSSSSSVSVASISSTIGGSSSTSSSASTAAKASGSTNGGGRGKDNEDKSHRRKRTSTNVDAADISDGKSSSKSSSSKKKRASSSTANADADADSGVNDTAPAVTATAHRKSDIKRKSPISFGGGGSGASTTVSEAKEGGKHQHHSKKRKSSSSSSSTTSVNKGEDEINKGKDKKRTKLVVIGADDDDDDDEGDSDSRSRGSGSDATDHHHSEDDDEIRDDDKHDVLLPARKKRDDTHSNTGRYFKGSLSSTVKAELSSSNGATADGSGGKKMKIGHNTHHSASAGAGASGRLLHSSSSSSVGAAGGSSAAAANGSVEDKTVVSIRPPTHLLANPHGGGFGNNGSGNSSSSNPSLGLCRQCRVRPADVIYLPCGCRCVCTTCSVSRRPENRCVQECTTCALCGGGIEDAIAIPNKAMDTDECMMKFEKVCTGKKNTMFLPCRCFSGCTGCAEMMRKCPNHHPPALIEGTLHVRSFSN